ncbi:MAG: LptF/LptG family permease [Planctomycetia bacterium]|nr:LptF/LptG family permease [Planctomycetia bacterium]
MKIVDVYIVKQFIKFFVLCYVSFAVLIMVFDITLNINKFLSLQTDTPIALVILGYYARYTFSLNDMLLPVLLCIVTFFTGFIMAQHNEIRALMALGVSPARVLAPMFFSAALISCVFTCVREFYVPNHLLEATQTVKDLAVKGEHVNVKRRHDFRTYLSLDGEEMNYYDKVIVRPKVMLNHNLNRYGNQISAEQGTYVPPSAERPGGWLLSHVNSPADILTSPSVKDEALDEVIIYTPADTPDLKEDEVFIVTAITPDHLVIGDNWRRIGPLKDLWQAAFDPAFARDSCELAINSGARMLRPLADLLPMFLGAPFLFFDQKRKLFVSIMYGFVLALVCVGSVFTCNFVGEQFSNVALGVWGSSIIFVPIGVYNFCELTRKE